MESPEVTSQASSIPFAFDFRANQLSYMSCSRSNVQGPDNTFSSLTSLSDPTVFYTFKIGAYDDAGLGLRQEFINYVKNNFTSKGVLADSYITDAITAGTAHSGAALQLAIRDTTPIDRFLVSFENRDEPSIGISYNLFPERVLLNMRDFFPQMIALFKTPGMRLSTLGTASLQQYKLESAIHFEQEQAYQENTAEQVRQKLSTQSGPLSSLLTITYSKDLRYSASPYIARPFQTAASDNRVWGVGYGLKFISDPRLQWKQNVIDSVQEYDLTTFEKTSNWTCHQSFRYIIIAAKDRGTYGCIDRDPAQLNTVQKQDLLKIRRHLIAEKWIVDPVNHCVSPKIARDDCYPNSSFREIDYRGATRCGIDSNGRSLEKDCPEFVSFCFRN